MATKSKNLSTNKTKVKYISLVFIFIFASILFETLFNLRYNFTGYNIYSFVKIPKFYFFGPPNRVTSRDILDDYQIIALIFGVLLLISLITYWLNKKSPSKVEQRLIEKVSKLNFESILLLIFFMIFIRFIVWQETIRFFDNPLIALNVIILFLIYVLIQYVIFNKNNLKYKILTYRLINDFISKLNKKSINKKIATILILTILTQSLAIFLFFRLYIYGYNTSISLFYAFILSLPSIFVFSYIYNILSKKFKYIEYLSKNVKNIENGDLKYQLDIKGHDELSNLALSINNITNGLDCALENQIKSEKMKTTLITNVSHDLKTPLTSIVNYVDILKNNELDMTTVKDYINILDRKSKRLKTLVDDIFEASKISSGDIELNIEKTNIKELLVQSIVELEDKIEESTLDFIINLPDECIYSMIDGKKTFRVFENIINNILKYSLSSTRVYIDMIKNEDNITLSFKNISNHRLNMSPQELLERFRRGDVSRNTEGSGLGLSIAQNLVSLQDGSMDLFIDGDLFKVILKFNLTL